MRTNYIYRLFKNSAGVNTDSRRVKRNEIFFALSGCRHNGNRYAAEAIENGALCAVIDDRAYETGKTVVVDDALAELQALAGHHRNVLGIPVLAITGTNGKTTTKELVASVLSKREKVHFTRGNLNNHIGVPLTILSAPPDTEIMVIEMGANHAGEIKQLCSIAQPDYGIITNAGMAHIEGFGSFEGVVRAKTELYEYLGQTGGTAIYDDANLLLAEKIHGMEVRAVPYSSPCDDGRELITEPYEADIFLKAVVVYGSEEYVVNTNLFGACNTENIKAAIATGLFFNVPMGDAVCAIEEYRPDNNRSQVKHTGRNTLVCDSYNANPSSMAAAIRSFLKLRAEKKAVILGDMLELGERAEHEHLHILNEIRSIRPENVFLAGRIFGKVAAGSGYGLFDDAAALRSRFEASRPEGFTILIKGSRGTGLEELYDVL
ncbi:MAG: UDP-N-acetylmuramoyl-tripeptide--D-alanyl-D-alanine ligase [Bacteroidales bacterium]|nr:UDP-N-acetylmuramoyl-tripeptide--D-alanyl-D-alanine ligase [Bacteroidales bacterium]